MNDQNKKRKTERNSRYSTFKSFRKSQNSRKLQNTPFPNCRKGSGRILKKRGEKIMALNSNLNEIFVFLQTLNFKSKDGTILSYHKLYDNYEIIVELNESEPKKSKINYGNKIKKDRNTTSNFENQENFVVLECVNRLLEKGYKPEDIILEKAYSSGRKEKGQFLDILVTKDEESFMMVECKVFGEEYEKEITKIKDTGGQLLSYFVNDRDANKLVLYTSKLSDRKFVSEYSVINSSLFVGSSKKNIFDNWNKEIIYDKGIFDESSKAYIFSDKGLTKSDLIDIPQENKIFNDVARILRKYAVSDKTNAYNKIFNLFLCKVVDEDYKDKDTDVLDFQWKEDETAIEVVGRLSKLYQIGMRDYLECSITDYSEEEILDAIKELSENNDNEKILKIYRELRFYKDNEFAFIDVFNQQTFKENARILKEIVRKLGKYRIKYSDKQQFLGDFFERLLNIGIKQESGQFFTPIPIANFVASSIPFEDIIKNKINSGKEDFLPYVIDYACGSGHFLTESMHSIDSILQKIKSNELKTRPQKDSLDGWKTAYKWASDFIYGIEKDYRLAKTTKIACFLNGDGKAKIITANGLDSFDSEKYRGLLRVKNKENYEQENSVFDLVIANPPYSVQDFKETLKDSEGENYGDRNFKLYKSLGNQSDDIECLFIERTEQLLKEGAFAGIVLANTVLTNSGIFSKAREILLKSFKIKAIVSLGSGAFMATNNSTIVLFLQKRERKEIVEVKNFINTFFSDKKDFIYNNKKDIISYYVADVYEDLNFKDYISILNNNPTETAMRSEIFLDLYDEEIEKMEKILNKNSLKSKEKEIISKKIKSLTKNKSVLDLSPIIEKEKKKLLYFILNFNVNILVANSGDKNEIKKEFLGYAFSNRKGNEGIKELTEEEIEEIDTYSKRSKINSKLYNPANLEDETKLNTYILKNMRNIDISRDITKIQENKEHPLNEHVSFFHLTDLMSFEDLKFQNKVKLKKKIVFKTKYELKKLKRIAQIKISSGDSAPQGKEYFKNGKFPFIRAENLNTVDPFGYVIPYKKNFINEKAIKDKKLNLFLKGTILFPKSGQSVNTNNIGILKEDSYVVSHLATIKTDNPIIDKYLFNFLKSIGTSNLKDLDSDYPTISMDNIKKLKIPFPDLHLNVQKKINDEIELIEKKEFENINKLNKNISEIKAMILKIKSKKAKLKSFVIMPIRRGKVPKYGRSNIQVIKSGQIRGNYDFDFTNKYYLSSDVTLDKRKLEIGDLLMNSTGVGTVGRTNLFEMDGNFVVDSHISIIRLDEKKVFPRYVLHCLDFLIGFKEIEKMAEGSSGQIELEPKTIGKMEIPWIKPEKQKEILTQIEPLEKEIILCKKYIEESQILKRNIIKKNI